MSDMFRFETFVDVHSNIFQEYLSSVIAKLQTETRIIEHYQKELTISIGNIRE